METTAQRVWGHARSKLPLGTRIYTWVLSHRKASTFITCWLLLTLVVLAMSAQPATAYAIVPIIPILGGIVAVIAGSFAIGEVGGSIEDGLRGASNLFISISQSMIASLTQADTLTKPFDQLFDAAYPVIHAIHQGAVITTANVVLLVFLVVALAKMVQDAGRTDAGVDVWKMCMVFVMYGVGRLIVDNSFELMILVYNIVRSLIMAVTSQGALAGALTVTPVPDDVKNLGALIVMVLVSFLVMVVVWAVCTLAVVVVIARGIKIYVQTCYAPIPLSFIISDGSRSMATGFIKKYLATVFSGAVLALLFVLFGAVVGNFAMTTSTPNSFENIVLWCCEMMFSITSVVAFGWAIFKSGAWAQEFVGL